MALVETALIMACKEAKSYLVEAVKEKEKVKRHNLKSCIKYIQAAQRAINGFEEEFDEIIIQSKQVVHFAWNKREQLYERIELFVNKDRLRPILLDSLNAIIECLEYAENNVSLFFGIEREHNALDRLAELKNEMVDYVSALSIDNINFKGPSGINVEELNRIGKLLLAHNQESGEIKNAKKEILKLAEYFQNNRVKEGYRITTNVSSMIQELTVSFQLL